MLLNDDTIAIQNELAAYCRDGKLRDITGARKDRLHNYRRLVFNVVEDALSQAYPITRSVLSDEEWSTLVNDFFIQHDPKSNQIWKMPFELFEYAEKTACHDKLKRPYLLELMYFEWVEIEVYCMPDAKTPPLAGTGDLQSDTLVVNPDHRLIHLNYPVHKKSWNDLESHKGNYFVLIFRQTETGKVRFIEVSSFFALVFEQLALAPKTALEAFKVAGSALGVQDNDTLMEKGRPFLQSLFDQSALLGFLA